MTATPTTTLDDRYSSEGAQPVAWNDAVAALERAGSFWVSTVRGDGRPHVTPVVGVWTRGAFYFSSGAEEQKSRNLAGNAHCAVTTGCNTWNDGLDVVLHGRAVVTRDLAELRAVAAAFEAKYGDDWVFEVGDDGTFRGRGVALVYRLVPTEALGFGKTDGFSHTRWRFPGTTAASA